jgi:hypothetical protein
MTDYGYIYCLSNPSMPGILKVGMTNGKPPEVRAKELFTTGVALPFKVECAKKVLNPKQKETRLHNLLSKYENRVNPKREFFLVKPKVVELFFELMDGVAWVKIREEEEEEEEEQEETQSTKLKKTTTGCRQASDCFKDKQRIRHTIDDVSTWTGIYDSTKNVIICNEKEYGGSSPLNQFATSHYKLERNDRTPNVNAWKECLCEVNGKWISTYDLKKLC